MPEKPPDTAAVSKSSERSLAAVVAVLIADRDERADERSARRSETVLAEAGFSHHEIARFTGKKPEAVRSTVRRTPMNAAKEVNG